MVDKHAQRFELEPGTLPLEWRCGTNSDNLKGIRRVQYFQPTYFTADWSDGVQVQVMLWGPRMLNDGSLGGRELDYRWKKTGATGPLCYADLPRPIRRRLMEYNEKMGFKIPLDQL